MCVIRILGNLAHKTSNIKWPTENPPYEVNSAIVHIKIKLNTEKTIIRNKDKDKDKDNDKGDKIAVEAIIRESMSVT